MRKLTEYNWIEETLDASGTIESVERISAPYLSDSDNIEIALKQDVWDGNGSDFGYAYINRKTGKLDEFFDDGKKVPARFHKQVKSLNK